MKYHCMGLQRLLAVGGFHWSCNGAVLQCTKMFTTKHTKVTNKKTIVMITRQRISPWFKSQ